MTYLMRLGIKGDWTTIQRYFSSDVYYKLRGLDLQSETLESLGLVRRQFSTPREFWKPGFGYLFKIITNKP